MTTCSPLRLVRTAGLGLAATVLLAGPALAQEGPRNQFDFAAFGAAHDTQLRSQGYFSQSGTWVDGESDLGLQKRRAGFGFGYQRLIGQNWQFSLDYLRTQRSAEQALPRAAKIQGQDLAAGTRVRSDVSQEFLAVSGGVALFNDGSSRFGVEVGGYVLSADVDVRPPASTHGGDVGTDTLPLLGLFGHRDLGAGLRLEGGLRLGKRRDSKITEGRLQLVWQATGNLHLGAGWRQVSGRFNDSLDWFNFNPMDVDFKLGGPQLSLRLAF